MHELGVIAATVSVCAAIISVLAAGAIWVAVRKNNKMALENGMAMVQNLERVMRRDAFPNAKVVVE